MVWYNYLAAFWAGAFLANAVPHFVHGISGNKFPTPFAKPPGKGLSSSTVNVLWSLFNLVIGYLLYMAGQVAGQQPWVLITFFAGIAGISIPMSIRFREKDKE